MRIIRSYVNIGNLRTSRSFSCEQLEYIVHSLVGDARRAAFSGASHVERFDPFVFKPPSDLAEPQVFVEPHHDAWATDRVGQSIGKKRPAHHFIAANDEGSVAIEHVLPRSGRVVRRFERDEIEPVGDFTRLTGPPSRAPSTMRNAESDRRVERTLIDARLPTRNDFLQFVCHVIRCHLEIKPPFFAFSDFPIFQPNEVLPFFYEFIIVTLEIAWNKYWDRRFVDRLEYFETNSLAN